MVCTLSRVGDVEHHQHAMTAVSAFLLNLQHTIETPLFYWAKNARRIGICREAAGTA
jgi:hypothetical protein